MRIAWSVFCGILCLLLIALWWRSYSYIDSAIVYRGGNWYEIRSEPGRLQFVFMYKTGVSDGWFFRSGMLVDSAYDPIVFRWLGSFRSVLSVIVAHWLAAMPLAMLAALPWIRWRYSLRAMLVAITLIALALGVVFAKLR